MGQSHLKTARYENVLLVRFRTMSAVADPCSFWKAFMEVQTAWVTLLAGLFRHFILFPISFSFSLFPFFSDDKYHFQFGWGGRGGFFSWKREGLVDNPPEN